MPLSAIEGVTPQQADALAEHNINDIDALALTSVDDLVEFLDLSLDEAETILNAAKAVVAMRDKPLPAETGEAVSQEDEIEAVETRGGSVELDESAGAEDVTPTDDSTAEGYDEAVESGRPYGAEPEILAQESVDPSLYTKRSRYRRRLNLQELGRDLRPDTIVLLLT